MHPFSTPLRFSGFLWGYGKDALGTNGLTFPRQGKTN